MDSATLLVNGIAISSELLTLNPTLFTASASLLPGSNSISLEIYEKKMDVLLTFATTIWIGSETLVVNLLSSTGAPFLVPTTITASLSDDPLVQSVITTSTGTATFKNIPDRTIILEAKGEGNEVGTAAAIGVQFSIDITMVGFNEPSTVENNDFSMGLAGWEVPTDSNAIALVDHKENVGPPLSVYPAAGLENKDIRLTTVSVAKQSVSRTFAAKFGSTGVRVRYRFITEEIPAGYFGSINNDFFSVSIRSKVAGGSLVESNSMNGLGLGAFDFSSGSTNWYEIILPLHHDSDTVEVSLVSPTCSMGSMIPRLSWISSKSWAAT